MTHKQLIKLPTLFSIAAACGLATSTFAQTPQSAPAPVVEQGRQYIIESLNFEGGSLDELIEELETKDPKFQTLLMTPEAGALKVPALKLRGLPAAEVLWLLNGETIGDGEAKLIIEKPPMVSVPIIKVRALMLKDWNASQPPRRVFARVVPGLHDGDSAASLASLLDMAAETMGSDSEPPSVKINPGARAVFVTGEADQLGTVTELIESWSKAQPSDPSEAQKDHVPDRGGKGPGR